MIPEMFANVFQVVYCGFVVCGGKGVSRDRTAIHDWTVKDIPLDRYTVPFRLGDKYLVNNIKHLNFVIGSSQ